LKEPVCWNRVVPCRGVATITGLCILRQDTPAGSQQQQQSADPQPQQLLVWPECDACEDPLLQHALQPVEPVSRLPLALSVLPSNMPAELLMTYQGEVRRGHSRVQLGCCDCPWSAGSCSSTVRHSLRRFQQDQSRGALST
jgi:hypothetical protein